MKPSRNMHRVNVSLTPEQEKGIDTLVRAGEYGDKSEAIRAAVREFIRKPPTSAIIARKRNEEAQEAEAAEQGGEGGE